MVKQATTLLILASNSRIARIHSTRFSWYFILVGWEFLGVAEMGGVPAPKINLLPWVFAIVHMGVSGNWDIHKISVYWTLRHIHMMAIQPGTGISPKPNVDVCCFLSCFFTSCNRIFLKCKPLVDWRFFLKIGWRLGATRKWGPHGASQALSCWCSGSTLFFTSWRQCLVFGNAMI